MVLPKLVPTGESSWDLTPAQLDGGLSRKLRHSDTAGPCIILRNRPPRWNEALRAYCLNFGGRVTMASVKNLQLACEEDTVGC